MEKKKKKESLGRRGTERERKRENTDNLHLLKRQVEEAGVSTAPPQNPQYLQAI